ncbi:MULTISPECIES: bis(5'-nucleosyl)-tetraphosphatase (symmetrical) YqeK [Synechocystis]|uniref:bis(5'-nucleosyl)-tetraphosphatase (symmetrical) n=1 Tax=Synechocystis salina LEGE 00031 TaxID=1828736 RepID=A0ABR9VVN0_9SYNC|nr:MULTISPECIES: bis(5'-nucleosyl)-tetraphosphatase (symmetrical) YqeK [Synechocystis]MBE9195400.1 bis(5'-nucleosyl)-tetraphosphatase (symmetrical) YqeK [Synechocystis sp. LEGE 06083]MBE9242291.1 bis(5'-nucleosyl)-tetraphosphatase (symmetrical) YqeK [Synechocystis salina LEGE 00041]MBE9255410.1 bis(5'-nucleosyl)-tetraphosphatase (symmetrical) YqeK [Synechocystis salina LEGE 00031]
MAELDRQGVIQWLRCNVSPQRLDHILGVEKTAVQWAPLHGVDPIKAGQAGLLHDLAKFFPPAKLLAIAEEHRLPLDPILQASPHLIHADVSAVIASEEFGVDDPDVLTAIRCHTLGAVPMDPLACLIFVADALEPTRGNSLELEKLRQVAQHNLYQAVRLTCEQTLTYLIKHHKVIHPRVILTRNWALQMAK